MKLASGVVTALLLALAACGGPSMPSYSSPQAAADKLGCSDYQAEAHGDLQYYVTKAGDCRYHGHDITINWYSDTDGRDQYTDTAKLFGGGVLTGGNWTIECPGPVTCKAMAHVLGGKVK